MHACIIRKMGNTLKDSVYAQMKWAINELGCMMNSTASCRRWKSC